LTDELPIRIVDVLTVTLAPIVNDVVPVNDVPLTFPVAVTFATWTTVVLTTVEPTVNPIAVDVCVAVELDITNCVVLCVELTVELPKNNAEVFKVTLEPTVTDVVPVNVALVTTLLFTTVDPIVNDAGVNVEVVVELDITN
jgi:hypothetical protein